jgi:hypothetical protein
MLMEFVQVSFLEEMEKMHQLENVECQQDSNYNSSHVGEGSSVIPKESSEFVQFGIVFTFTPIMKIQEELKLESNALITQRIQEIFLKNMSKKHEVEYKKLEAKLDLKEIELKDLE